MAIKVRARSRARISNSAGAKQRRDAWEATNAIADGLLLEMVDFERQTIDLIEAGLMSRAIAVDSHATARRSHREVLLCLRDLAATGPADFGPADQGRFRESLGTWRAMRRLGLRTLRRLDAFLASA